MKLRHTFGLMLCALLCLFAIGTKTAVYRPHQEQVKNLTSAKVWQSSRLPSVASIPMVQAPVLLALALLMLMATFTVSRAALPEQPAFASRNWYDPALAVRPPPSI
jgi:Na+/proline symporter